MDRRYFLKAGSLSLASFGLMAAAPGAFQQIVNAQTKIADKGRKKILVAIFQRGAVDGLSMVVPYGNSEYYDLRPTIAIQKPGKTDGAIDLDGHFGLHPAMNSLKPFWESKQMAIINCVGSPDNSRSHFDAQDYMESGTPGVKSTRDGWLNRALQTAKTKNGSPFRAVAMTRAMPRSLYGIAPAVAMTDLTDFTVKAGSFSRELTGGFEDIYAQNVKDRLNETGQETFEAINFLKQADPAKYKPAEGIIYPTSRLGSSMRQIAQLIKAGVGLEIAFTEALGWDTHINQGAARGQLANLLKDLADSIAAFTLDLGKKMDDVVLLTMSEFGRTAKQNGSRGTDHGHGNVMFALGNTVKGGSVYGNWKGLKNSELNEGRDLAVTTDFRDILAEAAVKQLGSKDLKSLFPNYAASNSKFRNFLS